MATTKLTMAKRMMTPKEIRANKQPFKSAEWARRGVIILKRVNDRAEAAHARKILRDQNKTTKQPTKKQVKSAHALLKKIEKKKARELKSRNKNK